MPWYHFTAQRGHSSYTYSEYKLLPYELETETAREDEWLDWIHDNNYDDSERVKGECVKIEKLPIEVIQGKIASYKKSIEHSNEMIELLEKEIQND